MAESLFISWKSIWRYHEITVDSATRQDGPWTIHLKLDKTWHLEKILFKVSETWPLSCAFHPNTKGNKKKFQVFGCSVGGTSLLFVLVDRLMLWLLGCRERLYAALIKSPKLIFKPEFRMVFRLSRILNFKWFGVLPGRETFSWKTVPNWQFKASEF